MKTIQDNIQEISKDFGFNLMTTINNPHSIMESLLNEEIPILKNIILKYLPNIELKVEKISGNDKGGLYVISDTTGIKREHQKYLKTLELYKKAIEWTKKELNLEKINIKTLFFNRDSNIHAFFIHLNYLKKSFVL